MMGDLLLYFLINANASSQLHSIFKSEMNVAIKLFFLRIWAFHWKDSIEEINLYITKF